MFEFFMRNDLILMLVSKAFDKIWHQGLLPKLKQNGISVNMLEALTDFFKRLRANIVLNGQNFSWENVKAGVPKDSFLGSLLLLIHINDLSENL